MTLAEVAAQLRGYVWVGGPVAALYLEADPDFTLRERIERLLRDEGYPCSEGAECLQPNHRVAARLYELLNPPKKAA